MAEKTFDYLQGLDINAIKGGAVPAMPMDDFFNTLRKMLEQGRQSSSRVLKAANERAGYTPVGLQSRVGAIQAAGENVAAGNMAAAMSQYQAQRAEGAINRYLQLWGMEKQQELQQRSAEWGLWGSVGTGIMDLVGMFSPLGKALAATGRK